MSLQGENVHCILQVKLKKKKFEMTKIADKGSVRNRIQDAKCPITPLTTGWLLPLKEMALMESLAAPKRHHLVEKTPLVCIVMK